MGNDRLVTLSTPVDPAMITDVEWQVAMTADPNMVTEFNSISATLGSLTALTLPRAVTKTAVAAVYDSTAGGTIPAPVTGDLSEAEQLFLLAESTDFQVAAHGSAGGKVGTAVKISSMCSSLNGAIRQVLSSLYFDNLDLQLRNPSDLLDIFKSYLR